MRMAHMSHPCFPKWWMKMKKKSLVMLAASLLCLGTIMPSFANGVVDGTKSFVGSATAVVIDIPDGFVVQVCKGPAPGFNKEPAVKWFIYQAS